MVQMLAVIISGGASLQNMSFHFSAFNQEKNQEDLEI